MVKQNQNYGGNVKSKIALKKLNRNINLRTRHKNGIVKSKRKVEKLYEKFRIYQYWTVLEELKQRVLTKVAKTDRYTKRIKQFKQNRHFTIVQKNYLPSWMDKLNKIMKCLMQIKVDYFGLAYE